MAPNGKSVRVRIIHLDSGASDREYISTGQPCNGFGELVFLDDMIPSVGARIRRLVTPVKTALRRLFQGWRRA